MTALLLQMGRTRQMSVLGIGEIRRVVYCANILCRNLAIHTCMFFGIHMKAEVIKRLGRCEQVFSSKCKADP